MERETVMTSSVALLRQMVDADPTNAAAWLLLGREYAKEGLAADALSCYTQALRHGDGSLRESVLAELDRLAERRGDSTVGLTPDAELAPPLRESVPAEAPEQPEGSRPGPLRVLSGGKQDKKTAAGDVTFADVGGLAEVKQAIEMKIIKPFLDPHLFARFRKKAGGGILLYGPPGCGKTFIARATAGECKAKFVSVHISDILGSYVGESEQNLHAVFTTARAQKPSVLFFDELDTLGYSRGKSQSHAMRGVIDQLLVEMDGMESDADKLLIIGATNMPWDVDAAFKRPGRFDKMLFVPPPDEPARRTIFSLKLGDKPAALDVNLDVLAQRTDLYSGADIDNVVELATERVLTDIMSSGRERLIQMDDLLTAVANTRPSTVEWLRTVKNYVKYANQAGAYNEVDAYLRSHRV